MVDKLQASEIASIIEQQISGFGQKTDTRQTGKVLEVGDGIARVYGLSSVMAGELVDFPDAGVKGLAFNLEENSVSVIILGNYLQVREGAEARTTGQLLSIKVGPEMVGRVVDPLGNPIDGKGPINTSRTRLVESPAPGIVDRQPVKQPLQTGIKAIDAMTPIGKGQRELIIGDRKTGKTQIALDTIVNQKGEGVFCVYVACGQMESKIAAVVEKLRDLGAMEYTCVVVASSADPAPLQYIAPYAGTAIAEYFMYEEGKDTLCVYDDLSKQAAAYRQLSLLVRRPPGREAYPGDVFYCHSRLLERSAKLAEKYVIVPDSADDAKVTSDWGVNGLDDPTQKRVAGKAGMVYVGPGAARGKEQAEHDLTHFAGHKIAKIPGTGGSLTALPIIETLEGEVSAYIPTNVISITDGQIYLQPELKNAGVLPAVDVGISVSRVGGNAQTKAMKNKQVAGGLKLALASFRELEAFAQLGTDLDVATQRQLDRGYRMVELLKQGQYEPLKVADQVMVIFAGNTGGLDKVARSDVRNWEKHFLTFMREQKSEVRDLIANKKDLNDDIVPQLKDAIAAFNAQYKSA